MWAIKMMDSQKRIAELEKINQALLGSISTTRLMNAAVMNGLNQYSMMLMEWHAAR